MSRNQVLGVVRVVHDSAQRMAHWSHQACGYRYLSVASLRRGVVAITLISAVAAPRAAIAAPHMQDAPPSTPPGGFAPFGSSDPFAAVPPSTPPQQAAPAAAPVAPVSVPPATPTELPAQAKAIQEELSPPPVIEISASGTITLSAQNVSIDALLELLSVRSKQNIVASDEVEGKVSVNLYEVPFAEALEAILSVNGLVSVRQGAFIFVYTQAEFATAERAKKQLGTQVFTMQFLNAADAEGFVKPILSKDGQMASRGTVVAGFTPTLENGGADDYAFTARLVVTDYATNLTEIARVLKEIDVAPKQVRVEATVISANIEENNAYGLDIAAIGNLNFQNIVAKAIPPLEIPDALRTGANSAKQFMTPYPTTAQAGSITNQITLPNSPQPNIKLGIISNDVAVFLTVLDDVTDLTVLARPAVTCLNRQRAAVMIQERVAYVSTTQNQTVTTQTVEYLDTGIELTFRPFITDDGMIRMELRPSISDYKLRNIGLPEGGETQVPDVSSQELRTNVRVRSGQTIVLGGLFSDKVISQRRQVPFLSEIPLVGGALTGQADQVKRQEIIFLVTPTVIEDEKLYEEGRDSLDVAQNVRVGARAGLLPFSREQITANYQQDAFESYARGDLSKALYYANAALRMKPVSPGMQQLRERLMAMPGSEFQTAVDETIIERRTFSPGSPSMLPKIEIQPKPVAPAIQQESNP